MLKHVNIECVLIQFLVQVKRNDHDQATDAASIWFFKCHLLFTHLINNWFYFLLLFLLLFLLSNHFFNSFILLFPYLNLSRSHFGVFISGLLPDLASCSDTIACWRSHFAWLSLHFFILILLLQRKRIFPLLSVDYPQELKHCQSIVLKFFFG